MDKINSRRQSSLKALLRFAVSFALIVVIFYLYRAELPMVLLRLKGAATGWAAAAFFFFFCGLFFIAVRLNMLFSVQGVSFSTGFVYYLNLIALFFNNFLPSAAGGEAVKAYYAFRRSGGNAATVSAIVVDRLVGMVTVVGIGVCALLAADQAMVSSRLLSSLLLMAAATAVLCAIVWNARLMGFFARLRLPLVPAALATALQSVCQAMSRYRQQRRILAASVFLTVLAQTVFVGVNYFLSLALGLAIPLSFFFLFVPLILILGVAPSVNGIGVREAAYLFYLKAYVLPEQALALSLCTTFLFVTAGLVGGLVYGLVGDEEAKGAVIL